MSRIQQVRDTVNRYGDRRTWIVGLWKASVHSATGAVLGAAGTNSVEGMSPDFLHEYTKDVGMNFRQVVVTFFIFLLLGAFRYVHDITKPGQSQSPFNHPTT